MKPIELSFGMSSVSRAKTECVPENLNYRDCHDRFEILYVAQGSGKYTVEGMEYPLKPRTLLLIPPYTYHHVIVDTGVTYERTIIYFDMQSVIQPAKASFLSIPEIKQQGVGNKNNTGCFYPSDSLSESVLSVIDRFDVITMLPEQDREPFFKIVLGELLILLSAAKREKFRSNDGELGAKVINYINRHISEDVSLETLSKRFFISKYYLCRAFKKYNGISVHGYINNKRVMYAKQLMEEGETASGAAYRVGFGDYSAFYRAYVKIIGKSPTAAEERGEDGV